MDTPELEIILTITLERKDWGKLADAVRTVTRKRPSSVMHALFEFLQAAIGPVAEHEYISLEISLREYDWATLVPYLSTDYKDNHALQIIRYRIRAEVLHEQALGLPPEPKYARPVDDATLLRQCTKAVEDSKLIIARNRQTAGLPPLPTYIDNGELS